MESDMDRCISRLMHSGGPFSGDCCWECHFSFVIVSLGQEITLMQAKKTVSNVCIQLQSTPSGCFRQLHPHESEKGIIYLSNAEAECLPNSTGNTIKHNCQFVP